MKILVINGDCIQKNSSANLCHLAYIQGMTDAGHEVTLLSADGRDYVLDSAMCIPENVKSYTYYGVSLYEKLSLKKRAMTEQPAATGGNEEKQSEKKSWKQKALERAKSFVLSLYGVHGVYATFVRKAQKFRMEEEFDYIVSISTPVTSHLLTHNLIKAGHIKGKHWIQIWEDPWYSDAYGFNNKEKIRKEEKRLLSFAEKVCYVSPLTLRNQQQIYPESAHKMFWQPLPYYYKNDAATTKQMKNVYGYFGDYAPVARNLSPFYEAAKECKVEVNICGNPSNLFEPTNQIHIYPRLSLDKLKPVEDASNVLIFLCNRKGGQIPGKIYQYSATDKIILFIMDGTEEEQEVLREYFGKFNRFIFCKNNKQDIMNAISRIEDGKFGDVENRPIDEFEPAKIMGHILDAVR